MRQGLLATALAVAVSFVTAPRVHARQAEPTDVTDVALPDGLEAARTLLHDRTSPSRALFLAEFIRRFYDTPRRTAQNEQPLLQAFLAHLERASHSPQAPADAVPLPLTTTWWIDAVFKGHAAPGTLVLDILRSRDTALLYWALLALDAPTRTWLAGERPVVDRLLRGRAALLVVAGPGVRVSEGRFVVPGGEPARDAWEALVGARTDDPSAFLARVLDDSDGALAYFLGRTARLPGATLDSILGLDARAAPDRVEALKRLYRVFRRAAQGWSVAGRPFSSMPDDPALLLADLGTTRDQRIAVPGDERFWTAVFDAHGDSPGVALPADSRFEPGLVDPVWLLEHVVRSSTLESRLRTDQVLFASRVLTAPLRATARDAAVTVAALRTYPALVRALERLRIDDGAVFRAAIERASSLRDIGDADIQARAIAQFQGTLALLARATVRGSIPRAAIGELISSLSAIPTSASGEYEGRLAAWIDAQLRPRAAAAGAPGAGEAPARVEDDLVRLSSAYPSAPAPVVEWEGTRYRLDLATAEARRIDRVRGESPPRVLSCAWALFDLAGRLARISPTSQDLSREVPRFEQAIRDGQLAPDDEAGTGSDPLVSAAAHLLRKAASGHETTPADVVTSVRRLADDLTARGLTELVYAAALGGGDGIRISSAEAASRHDFALLRPGEPGGTVAWRLPVPSVRVRGPWHIEGSLFDLDVALAESWLRRTSTRPLEVPPSIDRADRRVLSEVLTTMDPTALSDADRDRITAALRSGRRRLASVASTGELDALASLLPLHTLRRGLLPWIFTRDRDRIDAAFSLADLYRIGAGATGGSLPDAWGAPVRPRLGCYCLQFPTRAPDDYMGHLSSGILVGALPDLNLRLAEWMTELHMPAALLPSVLAGATRALVDRAPSRYPDDLRAIAEQAARLSLDETEQYLALLTTDGPLVPVEEVSRGSGDRP